MTGGIPLVSQDLRALVLGGADRARENAAECNLAEVIAGAAGGDIARTDRFVFRSVQEIIRFLGVLVRVQARLPLNLGGSRRCLTFAVYPADEFSDEDQSCLFQLLPAAQVPDAALRVTYAGENLAVPRFRQQNLNRPGDYSVLVLALVTDLINLRKSSSFIPTTRAVQIVR